MDETAIQSVERTQMAQEVRLPGSGALAQVEAYWEALRDDCRLPTRDELMPSALDGAFEHGVLLDRVERGMFRMRFAGRHVVDLMGMELRGMPLSALIQPGQRFQVNDVLEEVMTRPTRASIDRIHQKGRGKLLLLPMSPGTRGVAQALGCLVSDATTQDQPVRFEISRIYSTPLASRQEKVRAMPPRAFAEPAASFAAKPTRVTFLRLVETEKTQD